MALLYVASVLAGAQFLICYAPQCGNPLFLMEIVASGGQKNA
jgi:hypothetical protein